MRFLANRDRNLHFALLTDFLDADQRALPDDDALLDARAARHRGAQRALRDRHAATASSCSTGRARWNPRERRLDGLRAQARQARGRSTRFLRGGARDDVLCASSATPARWPTCATSSRSTPTPSCRATPRASSSARMAHPLNRAALRRGAPAWSTRATASCSRASASACRAPARSRFARLFGGEPGIDPYTRAVSDVYQDLFGEGSFVGKGIYDVDAFERALGRPLAREPHPQPRPARRLLRARRPGQRRAAARGLPVALRAPTSAAATAGSAATGSCCRGCCRGVPGADGARRAQPAVAAVALEDARQPAPQPGAGGADRAAGARLAARAGAAGVDAVRCWRSLLRAAAARVAASTWLRSPHDLPLRAAPAPGWPRRRARNFARAPLTLALPAVRGAGSASTRSRARCGACSSRAAGCWSGARRAKSSARSATACAASLRDDVDRAGARASARGVALARCSPRRCSSPRRSCCCGLLSPALMWWLSRPRRARAAGAVAAADCSSCGTLARRTWAFFETFVGRRRPLAAAGQLAGASGAAWSRTAPRRPTSAWRCWPTSRAYDFGYLAARRAARRAPRDTLDDAGRAASATAATSTTGTTPQTLQPLPPRYVSTVDSGNLAGHLLTLRQGLLALADAPLLPPRAFAGPASTRSACCARRAAHGRWPRVDGGARARSRRRLGARRVAPPATLADAARAAGRRWPARAARSNATPAAAAPSVVHWSAALRGSAMRAARRTWRGWRRGWRATTTRRRRDPPLPDGLRDAGRAGRRRGADARPQRAAQAALATGRGARARTHRRARAAGARRRRASREMDYDFLYDRDAPPARDRLQRRRAPPRRQLLRPARLGSAARAASSRSRRASCRRSTGSRSAAC